MTVSPKLHVEPLGRETYRDLVPDAALDFAARQRVFGKVHPRAEELLVFTEEGLYGPHRQAIKDLVLARIPEVCVIAGIGGRVLLESGRLIGSEPELQGFHEKFYATGHRYWRSLGLAGDDNPVKYAIIKSRITGSHPAFVAFDRTKLERFEPSEHVPYEAHTCWKPKGDFTTESAVRSVFHIVSRKRPFGTR